MTAPKLAYSLAEAAALVSLSIDTLRQAIKATQPPFLRAKRVGKKYIVTPEELKAWHDSLPDA